ncbi:MAG: exosortase A, partial [Pseudomonadota bacterium]
VGAVQVVEQFAFVLAFNAVLIAVLGLSVARQMIFPMGFLFFAVPFGEFAIPHLMEFTAWFTVAAIELTGIPVYRDGYFLTIPKGDFEIAKACSGIRYLIASFSLGTLYAYLTYNSLSRRVAFVVFSLALPIFANGLRAYGIVMLAHLSDMRIAVGVDHIIYGWLFFGVV